MRLSPAARLLVLSLASGLLAVWVLEVAPDVVETVLGLARILA